MTNSSAVMPVSEIANTRRPDFFPYTLPDNTVVSAYPREDILSLIDEHFDEVFKEGFVSNVKIDKKYEPGFLSTREEHKKIHSECFVFKKDEKVIGWSLGEMDDFETFYMRNTGILPAYQNNGIYKNFLDHFLNYLSEIGYQRVSSHHATSNASIISLKLNRGFIVVGNENHDRWGALVKMVKFLDPKREGNFKKLF